MLVQDSWILGQFVDRRTVPGCRTLNFCHTLSAGDLQLGLFAAHLQGFLRGCPRELAAAAAMAALLAPAPACGSAASLRGRAAGAGGADGIGGPLWHSCVVSGRASVRAELGSEGRESSGNEQEARRRQGRAVGKTLRALKSRDRAPKKWLGQVSDILWGCLRKTGSWTLWLPGSHCGDDKLEFPNKVRALSRPPSLSRADRTWGFGVALPQQCGGACSLGDQTAGRSTVQVEKENS